MQDGFTPFVSCIEKYLRLLLTPRLNSYKKMTFARVHISSNETLKQALGTLC